MEQLSVDCIAQHLKVFHEQAVFDRTADFGEACSRCPYAMKECRLDWLARMRPLFDRTDIQIRLDYPELPDTKDSHNDLHTETDIDKTVEVITKRASKEMGEITYHASAQELGQALRNLRCQHS